MDIDDPGSRTMGLDPQRDGITTVPVGSPVQILRALEEGTIDAALVSVKQSHELEAKGFSVLLKDYPADISSFGGGLVVTPSYLLAHPDVVANVVTALSTLRRRILRVFFIE